MDLHGRLFMSPHCLASAQSYTSSSHGMHASFIIAAHTLMLPSHFLYSLAGPTVTGELQSGQLAVGVSFCLAPEVGWATSECAVPASRVNII